MQKVTKADIIAAFDKLVAEGVKPTNAKVREITGGSYSLIAPIVAERKSQYRNQESQYPEIPKAVREAQELNLVAIWRECFRNCQAQAQLVYQDLEERLELERQALTEAFAHIEDLEAKNGSLCRNVAQLSEENQLLVKSNSELRTTLAGLQERESQLNSWLQDAKSQNEKWQAIIKEVSVNVANTSPDRC